MERRESGRGVIVEKVDFSKMDIVVETDNTLCREVTGVLSSVRGEVTGVLSSVREGFEIMYFVFVDDPNRGITRFNLDDLPVSSQWLQQHTGEVVRIKTSTEVSVVDVAEGV